MKKFYTIFIAFMLTALCLSCFGCGASASTGLEFAFSGDTAVLVGLGTCTDTDIVIPETVDSKTVVKIANNAFSGSAIKSVYIPKTVKEIGERAFLGCKELKETTILSGVRYGENVYLGSGVRKATIQDGVEEISKNLFSGATYLSEIEFSESVKKICDGAFSFSGIKKLTIPDTVTEIESNAFRGSKIEIAIIPTSVTTMGKYVFADCGSLNFVTLNASEKPAGWDTDWCSDLTGTIQGDIVWGGHVHEYEILSQKSPTCLIGGKTVYKCAECNKEKTILSPLDENAHVSEDGWQIDSTTHKKRCDYCRQTYGYGYHEYEDGKCKVCEKAEIK